MRRTLAAALASVALVSTAPSTANAAEPAPSTESADSSTDDPTTARKLDLSGRIMTYVRVPTGSLDRPFQQVSSSLWIDARARMSGGTYASVSLIGSLLTPSLEGNI